MIKVNEKNNELPRLKSIAKLLKPACYIPFVNTIFAVVVILRSTAFSILNKS